MKQLLYKIVTCEFSGCLVEQYRSMRDVYRVEYDGLRIYYREIGDRLLILAAECKIKNPS